MNGGDGRWRGTQVLPHCSPTSSATYTQNLHGENRFSEMRQSQGTRPSRRHENDGGTLSASGYRTPD